MAVDAYTGLPGSGKSYSAVALQVIPALKAGRKIATNMPIKADLLEADFNAPKSIKTFTTQEIEAAPERLLEVCPPGWILILDETWRLFPAGWQVSKIPDAYKSFFAEHRHRVDAEGNSTNIVLVTQDLAQISAFARQLVETTYTTTKLTTLGQSKRYRVDVYHGAVTGDKANEQRRLRQIFGKYEPSICRYYTSHTQSEYQQTGAANEGSIDGRQNILKRPLLMAAPLIIIGLIAAGIYGLKSNPLSNKHTGTRDGFTTLAPARDQVETKETTGRRAPRGTTGTLAGLCMMGRCGWALYNGRWISLSHCRQIELTWKCDVHRKTMLDK